MRRTEQLQGLRLMKFEDVSMTRPTRHYGAEQLRRISDVTIAHYNRAAEAS